MMDNGYVYGPSLTPEGAGVIAGILGSMLVVFTVIALIWGIVAIIANWRIFSKAGEAGWKAIIPIYNVYTQFKFSWNTQMFLLMFAFILAGAVVQSAFADNETLVMIGSLISLGGSIISLLSCHKLSLAFGHGIGFTLGLIFLNPIFILILAFGSSQYQGNPTRSGNMW